MLKQRDPALHQCIGLAKQVSNQLKPVGFCPEMGPAPGTGAEQSPWQLCHPTLPQE